MCTVKELVVWTLDDPPEKIGPGQGLKGLVRDLALSQWNKQEKNKLLQDREPSITIQQFYKSMHSINHFKVFVSSRDSKVC